MVEKENKSENEISQEVTKDLLVQDFLDLNRTLLSQGVTLKVLRSISSQKSSSKDSSRLIIFFVLPLTLISVICLNPSSLLASRCILANNYLLWEFTRPVSDCYYCSNTTEALILKNVSRESFKLFAYSSRPMIAKGAAKDWPASRVFSLDYFRQLYDEIPDAYESVVEECQFLHFHSDFENLQQVLQMDRKRAQNEGSRPWYVGWKNCHPQVLEHMRQFYQTPSFLPDDAEVPPTNYVFLGYEQGAHMHLDYIPRLMWQAQLQGSKTWTVAPTPECNHVCKPFKFFVDEGDIILLDTRVWYHSTQVENGTFSMTVTSEYG